MKFYCYKKCSTCKKAAVFLRSKKIQFDEIDYTEYPLSKEQLREYWKTSGAKLNTFFNTSGLLYRSMDMKSRLPAMSNDEKITILSRNPMLIKRPVLILPDTVLVGFNENKWDDILQNKEEV